LVWIFVDLSLSSGASKLSVKLDPVWELLRKDPRFQAVIDSYGNG